VSNGATVPARTASPPSAASLTSVAAVVTFILLAIDATEIFGVFGLVLSRVEVNTFLSSVITGILASTNTLLVMATSYWVGSTTGAKATGDAIAASNLAATTAVATLAGAPPKPAPVVPPSPPGGTVANPLVVEATVKPDPNAQGAPT